MTYHGGVLMPDALCAGLAPAWSWATHASFHHSRFRRPDCTPVSNVWGDVVHSTIDEASVAMLLLSLPHDG
jgi:hypothetical protein